MSTTLSHNQNRLQLLDALRGFALISILLLHNIEKYEVYGVNVNLPSWMLIIDQYIWDSFFFVFGGKSYAIFALLFGLTFFIQSKNQEQIGKNFTYRFIWRMFLLLCFGLANTLFYQGEILVMYAMVGVFILPFYKMSNKALLASALFFLLQPIMWAMTYYATKLSPDIMQEPSFIKFYEKVGNSLKSHSIFDTMQSNITNGRIASLLWYWENGRIDQTLGLFLLGIFAGRKGLFYYSIDNLKLWRKILFISALCFLPLLYFKLHNSVFIISKTVAYYISLIFGLWVNLALMLVIVSGFVLLFYKPHIQTVLNKLAPIGKMGLTNYFIQSVIGSAIYYGFGLAMYQYVGATYSLLIGVGLAFVMWAFSNYWTKHHKRGILETLWHQLTWIGANKT